MHHRSMLLQQTQANLGSRRSWVKASLYSPGGSPSFCMLGGLGAARFYPQGITSQRGWWAISGKELFSRRKYKDPEMKAAIEYIAKAIYHHDRTTWWISNIVHFLMLGPIFGEYPRRARIVASFNDCIDTTFRDVHAVLDLAQEYAMEDEKKEIAAALAQTATEEHIIERQRAAQVEHENKERV